MKLSNPTVLTFIRIVLWINIIFFIIATGSLIYKWIILNFQIEHISTIKKDGSLTKIHSVSSTAFHLMSILYLFYNLISIFLFVKALKLFKILDLKKTFNKSTLELMYKITKLTFLIAMLDILINFITEFILNSSFSLNIDINSSGFLVLAAVLYIFTSIYKQGVDLQCENDLTI